MPVVTAPLPLLPAAGDGGAAAAAAALILIRMSWSTALDRLAVRLVVSPQLPYESTEAQLPASA